MWFWCFSFLFFFLFFFFLLIMKGNDYFIYTWSFKCLAPILFDKEQKQILPGGKMTAKDNPTISCSHLVLETSVLADWKNPYQVATAPIGWMRVKVNNISVYSLFINWNVDLNSDQYSNSNYLICLVFIT